MLVSTMRDGTVEIRTPRLLLRAAQRKDVSALHEMLSNESAMTYWSHAPFTEISQSEAWLEQMIDGPHNGVLEFAIDLLPSLQHHSPHEAQMIGKIGCWDGEEIGFILHPSHWGNGYATEALDALLKYLFKETKIKVIKADVDPRNNPSLRLLKRFGFRETGMAEKTFQTHVGWCDSVYLELHKPLEEKGLLI